MTDAEWIDLPEWAVVTDKRRAHIARVTALLVSWSEAMHVPSDEATAWRDAGRLHDALRDADEPLLRALANLPPEAPKGLLHGPACATKLRELGETRASLLEAITWHTTGCAEWDRTGRALYMADYLEPGRPFAREDRARLAAQVPGDFDGVFRSVVRSRIEWTLREGKAIFPETAALWNAVR